MKTVVTTVLACLVIAMVGGLAFIYSGIYDVAATSPHGPTVEWVLETAREASVDARAEEIEVPSLADDELRERGFRLYHEMCVTCHAAPGLLSSEIGSGLYPVPPELAEEEDEEPEELFWIVKNGIKDSGMPAFGPTHDDEQIWALVAFLQELPEISADDYHRRADAAGLQVSSGHSHGDEGGAGSAAGGEGAAGEDTTAPSSGEEAAGDHEHEEGTPDHEHGTGS